MSRRLFTHIVREVTGNVPYFQKSSDCTGKVCISALMKCASAIRQLEYDTVRDALDEYMQLSVKTSRDCLEIFCKAIIDLYGKSFCGSLHKLMLEKLHAFHKEKHRFSGMLGNIDCTDLELINCPTILC
ncbi:hypothetical protein Tco_1066793 [Tanacetum coccineum]|uniref:Uncharacterized protein n=1 Tax=Tanacetum coccineum TaxID=301880 RepID=A0ABQ5HCF0_9ASTR